MLFLVFLFLLFHYILPNLFKSSVSISGFSIFISVFLFGFSSFYNRISSFSSSSNSIALASAIFSVSISFILRGYFVFISVSSFSILFLVFLDSLFLFGLTFLYAAKNIYIFLYNDLMIFKIMLACLFTTTRSVDQQAGQ